MGLYHYPGFCVRGRSELAAAQGVCQWISVNVPRDSALLYDNDPMLYLYTGQRSIGGQVATDLPGLRLVQETPRLSIYAVKWAFGA